jgi:molybdopterin adenylyltransferase
VGRVTRARREGAHAAASGAAGVVVRCAVLTVSDTRRGAADTGGDTIERRLTRAGHAVVTRAWVRDTVAGVRDALRAILERPDIDVVVVTGGTGIGPRDRTPEAVSGLFDTPLPGFGELFRMLSYRQVGAAAWLSRASAGVARGRLVVLLPGSVRAVTLALDHLLLPELVHAVRMLGRAPHD